MALTAQLGSRRQAILLGALAVVLLLAVVRWRPGGGAAAPPPSSSTTRASSASSRPSGGDVSGEEAPSAPRPRRSSVKEVNPDDVPVISVKDLAPPSSSVDDPRRDLFELRDPTR